MQLPVPYFSQHTDVTDKKWREYACTITNLAMVFGYAKREASVDTLIEEGESIGGFLGKDIGWGHESVVRLARNHGISAYRQEFRSNDEEYQKQLTEEGIKKIAQHIENGNPVMVSVRNNFDATRGLHTVLLIGVERDENRAVSAFVYHDPDNSDKEGENQRVEMALFLEHWRKLCIFFEGV